MVNCLHLIIESTHFRPGCNNNTQKILLKIGKYLITLLSHPQIAYELIEAGGAEDILQNKIYI